MREQRYDPAKFAQGRHRFDDRHGDLSQLHAGRALRVAAENLADELLHYDCLYCINRRSSSVQRARFTPEEVVQLTLDFYRRNYIEGLFLSSGIIRNSDYTMEQVVRVVRTLRVEHGFRGYIHLKTIPEASSELIAEAGKWADRISINVELPTQQDLTALAPEKNIDRIETSMKAIKLRIEQSKAERRENRKAPAFAPPGQSTQMLVGATPANDATILQRASSLYRKQGLSTRLLFRIQSDPRCINETTAERSAARARTSA